jgi:hypothetical protein
MRKYNSDNLEIHIYYRGPDLWEWIVAEKSKGAILSGEVKGARWRAKAEASAALRRLSSR